MTTTIRIPLEDGVTLTEIRVSSEIYNHSQAWRLRLSDGNEAIIKRDGNGIWMQRSKDNLNPEVISRIGDAIEECFSNDNY